MAAIERRMDSMTDETPAAVERVLAAATRLHDAVAEGEAVFTAERGALVAGFVEASALVERLQQAIEQAADDRALLAYVLSSIGNTYRALAAEFGLSAPRVGQIATRGREVATERGFAAPPVRAEDDGVLAKEIDAEVPDRG